MKIDIRKADTTLDVPGLSPGLVAMIAQECAMHPNGVNYIWAYGFTQSCNDAHSAIDGKNDPEAASKSVALAQKKLAAILSGDINIRSVGNPLRTKAMELARDFIRKGGANKNPEWMKLSAKAVSAKAAEMLDYEESFLWSKARRILEIEAEAAETDEQITI